MQRFEHVVANQNGTFLPGASVTVTIANATPGTGAGASLFSDEGTTSLGTSTVVSDSNGRVVFYVADGKYDLTFTGVGITTYIRAALEIADMTGTTFAADSQGKFNTLAVSSNATVGGTLGVTGAITGASLTTPTIIGPSGQAVNVRGGAGTTFAFSVQNSTVTTNLLIVDNAGNITTLSPFAVTSAGAITGLSITSGQVIQPAATAFTIKDNQGGTRYSIPSGGVAQAQINNTSLTGANTANNVTVLNAQGATTAITGTGADAVIYTYTLPANTLDTNTKAIRISCAAAHNSGTANPAVKINVNGVNVVTGSIGTVTGQSVNFEALVLRTSTTTAGSKGMNTNSNAQVPFSITVAGLNWTANQTITFTFNVAATDQMTGIMFMVEQIQ